MNTGFSVISLSWWLQIGYTCVSGDTYKAFEDGAVEDVKGFCAAVPTSGIARQDYILTPGRYVGIPAQEDDGEPFEEKMVRLTGELSAMFAKSRELEEEIRKRLGAIGFEI